MRWAWLLLLSCPWKKGFRKHEKFDQSINSNPGLSKSRATLLPHQMQFPEAEGSSSRIKQMSPCQWAYKEGTLPSPHAPSMSRVPSSSYVSRRSIWRKKKGVSIGKRERQVKEVSKEGNWSHASWLSACTQGSDFGRWKGRVFSFSWELCLCIFSLWTSNKALLPSAYGDEGDAVWGFQDYNVWHSLKACAPFYDIKHYSSHDIWSCLYFFPLILFIWDPDLLGLMVFLVSWFYCVEVIIC